MLKGHILKGSKQKKGLGSQESGCQAPNAELLQELASAAPVVAQGTDGGVVGDGIGLIPGQLLPHRAIVLTPDELAGWVE